MSLIIVVNLSEPHAIFTTIETLLNVVKARIKFILDKSIDGDDLRAFLEEKTNERIGKNPELDLISPFLIPLMIIGGKFDKFQVKIVLYFDLSVIELLTSQEIDLKKRTIICKTLRFLNHIHGGSLLVSNNAGFKGIRSTHKRLHWVKSRRDAFLLVITSHQYCEM